MSRAKRKRRNKPGVLYMPHSGVVLQEVPMGWHGVEIPQDSAGNWRDGVRVWLDEHCGADWGVCIRPKGDTSRDARYRTTKFYIGDAAEAVMFKLRWS